MPFALEALEHTRPRAYERDLRSTDEVTDRSGHEDLGRLGGTHQARGDVHADPAYISPLKIDFTGVHPCADVESHAPKLGPEGLREADRLVRRLEHRELPVTMCFITRPRNRLARTSPRRS
jgi:hypothetical protein